MKRKRKETAKGGWDVREMLHDRSEAGRLLAERLTALRDDRDVVVLGLPRGGVPVACGIATDLRLPLDVFLCEN